MKTKEQKQQDIALLKEEFGGADNALIVSFQGLTVEKDWELRRALEKAELNYRVVKNTLVKIAVEGTPLEPLKDHFTGMTAVAYSEKDPVGLAKVLSKFAKDNAQLKFKAGIVEGRVINVKDVDALAALPRRGPQPGSRHQTDRGPEGRAAILRRFCRGRPACGAPRPPG